MSNRIDPTESVIDSRDVIARIEELRDMRQPFVTGWNMCGYMPDSDPAEFADIEDARAYVAEMLRERAEELEEQAAQIPLVAEDESQGESMAEKRRELAAEYRQAAEYAERQESAFSVVVGSNAFWVADAENGGLNPIDAEELAELEKLAEEASSSPDWEYGETLINRDYFVTYIEEIIDDCYQMPKEFKSGEWPWRHMTLDYEAAAAEAEVDYTEVEYFGRAFLIRA